MIKYYKYMLIFYIKKKTINKQQISIKKYLIKTKKMQMFVKC